MGILGTPQQITDLAADLSGFKNLTGLRVITRLLFPASSLSFEVLIEPRLSGVQSASFVLQNFTKA